MESENMSQMAPGMPIKHATRRFAGLLALACLFTLPLSLRAQTVAPLEGIGNVQFFNNDGSVLTAGVLYSFQAGTSTQQATFTDSTGLVQNVNPITFGSGARASIWLTIGQFYKFVLCVQNDGPACAAGDILFTVDNVPGGSGSGGGGGGPVFTGIFVSNTPGAATSGSLRLASSDTICWRNAVGSANLCISKDNNDLLSWAGGSLKFPEVVPPPGSAGFDVLWADNTAHRWMMKNNNGTADVFAGAATTDTFTNKTFDAQGAGNVFKIGGTTITNAGQSNTTFLRGDGTWVAAIVPVVQVDTTGLTANIGLTTLTTATANGFYHMSCFVIETVIAGTSSTLPSCVSNFTSADTSGVISLGLTATNNANVVGTIGGFSVFQGWIYAKSGTPIQYSTISYASNPATTMTYAIHIRLEGPF